MKRALFLMIGCLVGLVMIANPITKEEAQQKAVQFLSKKQSNRALAPRLKPVSLQEVSGLNSERLYAFNVGQKNGFVVMSADDCTGELILGYADKGELSMETMPDNMRAWLKGYDDEIKWMQEHGVTNEVAASRANSPSAARTPISPLLTSRWNQAEPYNTYCPIYSKAKCVTGCVATATAQVLYYYGKKRGESTTTLKAIPGYTTATHSLAVDEKAVRTFDWSKMSDIYPSNAEANEEVARLMEYVGAGLKMNYRLANVGGSLAYHMDIPYVLTEYFGYDKSARYVTRSDYSYSDWISMMYEMLSKGNPVLYGGQSTGGGHSFVLDGYAEEDYFHVNWGWGGDSDGHFKLSVLYSEKQGIGGSTSQDGYSSGQEAIIDVNPVSSGVDTSMRMTVTKAYYDDRVCKRSSSNENFTNVKLFWNIYNYTGATAGFDFGWGLYRGDQFLKVLYHGYHEALPNRSGFINGVVIEVGADLSDGEYLLKPISRKIGTDTWYPDFGSEIYYITATISGNTLTLARSVSTDLWINDNNRSVSADPRVGTPMTVTATISNRGTMYSGEVSVGKVVGGTYSEPIYQKLAAQQVEITPGDTKEVTFTFTPSTAGNMELYLLDKDNNAISNKIDITVSPNNATTGTLAIDWENDITLDNAYSPDCKQWYYGFYGSKILGHVKVTNNSTTDAHTSGLLIRLWKKNGDNYSSWDSHTYATDIAANGGTQTINFVFDELEVGTSYLLTYHYTNGAELLNDLEKPQVEHYPMQAYYGVTTIAADGTETTVAPTASVTVPDNALVLDISQLTTVTSVTPNSNPNTLYIVGTSAPSGLDGKNVVQNGTAATLTLQDGYGFYTPIVFTATNVSYTRTFTTGADGTNGWSTIVLPFDVKQVKQGDKVIDWFHKSSDTGKHFWVKKFSSEDGSTVNFDFVDQMKADTPYIIAVPGSTWGESWNLTNKPITFYGANATFEPGTLSSVSGYHYKFAGTKQAKSVTDCYVMNNEGNAFNKTTATVEPFRAYFSPLTMMSGQPAAAALYIGSEGNNPTGITEMTYDRQETKGAAYNLNGQRVAHPRKGLYIVDGKKVIMK